VPNADIIWNDVVDDVVTVSLVEGGCLLSSPVSDILFQ